MRRLFYRVTEGVLVLLILFVCLVIVGELMRPHQDQVRLKALVRASGIAISVGNLDHQDWRNVRVRVNDKYRCPALAEIEHGEVGTVPLFGCATPDGERFQVATTKPVSVTVQALLAVDTREAVAGFEFGQ